MTDQLDAEDTALIASLVGRTIVRAEWIDANPDDEWTGHEEAKLWLDDGRVVTFGGWGHDAWGATVSVYARSTADG